MAAAMLVDSSAPVAKHRPAAAHQALRALSGRLNPPAGLAVSPAPKLVANYGKLPLSFEANQGQTDPQVKFLSRGPGYGLFLTGNGAMLELQESGAMSQKSVARTKSTGLLSALRRTTESGSQTTDVLQLKLVHANENATIVGARELPGKVNYFIGNDPRQWRTNVPTFAQVRYENVYPGIDLVYHGNQSGQLEYDFVVAPGADPGAILLGLDAGGTTNGKGKATGRQRFKIDSTGDLLISINGGDLRFGRPVVYQELSEATSGDLEDEQETGNSKNEKRKSPADNPRSQFDRRSLMAKRQYLDGRFVLRAGHEVGFKVTAYDAAQPLIIDPTLSYSTFLGGTGGASAAAAIALDSEGNAYVTGSTQSAKFDTADPLYPTCGSCTAGNGNAFVAELNASGTALVYSTYLGGNGNDVGAGIAVDAEGNAYVAGTTNSTDFPTKAAFQPAIGGGSCGKGITCSDAFVAKLSASGSGLVYSTYLGGNGADSAAGIALDSAGDAYITGSTQSTNFPMHSPLQGVCGSCTGGNSNAFVAELNATGSALVYSTYLGGTENDSGAGIAVDSIGSAYVVGTATSTNFPTTAAAYQPVATSACTAPCTFPFVAKLNAGGNGVAYSTYLNTGIGSGIAVDAFGSACVTGATSSSTFPVVNAFQMKSGGAADAFVTKFNAAGSALDYSTYLGGSGNDSGAAIAVDSSGNAYVTGTTDSANFPVFNAYQGAYGGNGDAFAAVFSASDALLYSTYLGGDGSDSGSGVAVDSAGDVYLAGSTASTTFPVAPSANPLQGTCMACPSGTDAFVAELPGIVLTIGLNPASIAFSPQIVETTSPAIGVVVQNTGTANLTISSVAIIGLDPSDFEVKPGNCANATLLPNSTCSISIVFRPTATGSRSAAVAFTANTSASAPSVSLTGTGMSLNPVANISPTSLTYTNQSLGTTSPPQTVTLANTGTDPLSVSDISTSAYFAQTNNCDATVATGAACTINVTFSPTTAGPLTGALTITDNNNGIAGSRQRVPLNGTGQDFALSVPMGYPTSATVAPGQSATYTLSVVGEGGLNQAVQFTCTGAPAETTCTVSPSSIIPGTSATNITVSVATTASSGVVSGSRLRGPLPPSAVSLRGLLMVALLLAALASAVVRRSHSGVNRWRYGMAMFALGLLLTLSLASCGGGGGGALSTVTSNPGTPAGTSTLTVTGTTGSGSSALSHSVTLTLTVS
jgi:hypothetical protein